MIILGNPAKNLTKIRPLGPILDLCLLKKKVSTCTILVFAYYPIIGGGLLLAQTTPTVVGAGLPWDFPPTLTQAFPCLLWVIFPWFWVINSLIIHAESWPNSADFWCVPQKFVGFVAWLSLAPVMLGQCFSWVILGPVRRILKRRCPCLRCRAGRKSLSGWAIHPHPDMLGVGVLPIVR